MEDDLRIAIKRCVQVLDGLVVWNRNTLPPNVFMEMDRSLYEAKMLLERHEPSVRNDATQRPIA